MAKNQRNSQMIRVAELYYERNLSQQQIAKIMGCSHSTVSRLLAEARETGVVEITIHRDIYSHPHLSEQLRKTFALRDAIVVPTGETVEDTMTAVGTAAAQLLTSILEGDMTVGITWGATLFYVIQALDSLQLSNVEVIQMCGALGDGNPEVDGPKIAIRLAECLGGTVRLVAAPTMVESADVCVTLMNQPQIRHTLARAAKAKIMIMGIGSLMDQASSLARAGYISESDQSAYLSAGAVGHIVGRMINVHGEEVGDDRVVGVSLAALQQADWTIGISASVQKAPAILGALRGKHINTLVVEEESAREVLRLMDETALTQV